MKTDLKKQSLSEIFAQSAIKYSESFGWLDDLIVFSEKGLIYISDFMKEDLKDNPQTLKKYLKKEIKDLKEAGVQAFACLTDYMDDLSHHFASVVLNISSPSEIFNNEAFGSEKSKIFEFDHEFGHLIADQPYIIDSENKKENIADIFALLMHIKRFGKTDIKTFDEAAFTSANYATINNNPAYYASPAIFAAKAMAEEIDIQELSLKQIAKCATQIGYNFALPKNKLEKIHQAYTPAREVFNDETSSHEDILKNIAQVMLKNKKSPDIYRAGKLYLLHHDNQILLEPLKTHNPFWQKTFKEMTEYEEKTRFNFNPIKTNVIEVINNKKLPKCRFD